MCNYVAYNRFYKLHLLHLSHKTASDISLREKETHKDHSKNTHEIAIKHKVKANLLLASYSPENYKTYMI